MRKVEIAALVWDNWNTGHIRKHNLTINDVETIFRSDKVLYLSTYEGRIVALGRSGTRLLTVVLAKEENRKYYVVTARDMDKKERGLYREKYGQKS